MNGIRALMTLILMITANSVRSWTCPLDCICLSHTQVNNYNNNNIIDYYAEICWLCGILAILLYHNIVHYYCYYYIISRLKFGFIPTTELDTADILKFAIVYFTPLPLCTNIVLLYYTSPCLPNQLRQLLYIEYARRGMGVFLFHEGFCIVVY